MAIESVFDNVRDPQKVYNWEIEFFSSKPTNENAALKYYAKNVALPLHSVEYAKRYFCGSKYHTPMKDNSPSIINVTMWDNELSNVYAYFAAWFFMINKTQVDFSIVGALGGILNTTVDALSSLTPASLLSDGGYSNLVSNRTGLSLVRNVINGAAAETGAIPEDYLMNCNIKLLNQNGDVSVIHRFTNCFVAELGEINLNYNESSDITFDVKMVYDKYKMERV